jgi:hypothetical protein
MRLEMLDIRVHACFSTYAAQVGTLYNERFVLIFSFLCIHHCLFSPLQVIKKTMWRDCECAFILEFGMANSYCPDHTAIILSKPHCCCPEFRAHCCHSGSRSHCYCCQSRSHYHSPKSTGHTPICPGSRSHCHCPESMGHTAIVKLGHSEIVLNL